MAKILFINGNLHGHFNPTIPLVSELTGRGEEVWYFCSHIFKDKVEAAGANIITAGDTLEEFYKNYRPTGNHPFYTLVEYIIKYDEVLIPEVLHKIAAMKFDYIIYDSILGAGYFLKNILKVPVICSNSSFVMNQLPVPDSMLVPGTHPQLDEFYHVLDEVCGKWQVAVPSVLDLFINKGDLNITYTSKEFNPGGDSFDESYKFLGPSIAERKEEVSFPFDELKGQKVIYISLGTINTDFNRFYELCMDTLKESPFKVVMSVGKKCDISSLGKIPDNFIVKDYVPQLEILKQTDVFISHGGFNSVSEALYFEVPIIVLPMVNDQFMVAKRIAGLGAGIPLKMNEITPELLKTSIDKLLLESSYKEAARKISQSFHQGEGLEKAADYILNLR